MKQKTTDPITNPLQHYNCMDCMLTFEVFERLKPSLPNRNYNKVRALQAPALAMTLRGIAVDTEARELIRTELDAELELQEAQLIKLAEAYGVHEYNARSPKTTKLLLERMGCQARNTGDYTLQELIEKHEGTIPAFVLRCIRAVRAAKKLGTILDMGTRPLTRHIAPSRVLEAVLNARPGDLTRPRVHANWKPPGTETGRWSATKHLDGSGMNLQTPPKKIRRMFVADILKYLGQLDFAQAESRIVGAVVLLLTGDRAYLDACQSGDMHTAVAKQLWPDLHWTDDLRADKELASSMKASRHLSYRDLAKRAGHATNYGIQVAELARVLGISRKVAADFQATYFGAYPGIRKWHENVARLLQEEGEITTLLGRRRIFFGDKKDRATLKEAIAYEPQSVVAECTSEAIYKMWEDPDIEVLAHVHDAAIIQFERMSALERAIKYMQVQIPVTETEFVTLPVDASYGLNWGEASDENPDGLKEYSLR